MDAEPKIKLYSFTMDCTNPHELAKFYAELLKWEIIPIDEEYIYVVMPGTQEGSYPGILFQQNHQYQPPVWPITADAQQHMAHIDFAVSDLEYAVQHAISCGATIANEQFADGWRVMIDPAGHPFCLFEKK